MINAIAFILTKCGSIQYLLIHRAALASQFSFSLSCVPSSSSPALLSLRMIFNYPVVELQVKAKATRDHVPDEARVTELVLSTGAEHAPEEHGAVVEQDLHHFGIHRLRGASNSLSPRHLFLKFLERRAQMFCDPLRVVAIGWSVVAAHHIHCLRED